MSKMSKTKLADLLDEDIDQFMEALAARQTEKPFSKAFDFDEWSRQLDSHPVFMKTEPKLGETGEYSESIQALQALKYDQDDDDEDPLQRATKCKDEGNRFFQSRKYHWAIDCYTKGIKVRCANRQINSVLYANRAASNRHLGNLRSAVHDCLFALRFDANNTKALLRGAECLLEMGYGARCEDWLRRFVVQDEQMMTSALMEQVSILGNKATKCRIEEERNARKARRDESKQVETKRLLLETLKQRKLCFEPNFSFDDPAHFDTGNLEIQLPQLDDHPMVYLDRGILYWPILLQYPEVGQTDFLRDCAETSQLGDIVEIVTTKAAAWDEHHQYRPNNIRCFLALTEGDLHELQLTLTLEQVLSTKGYAITHGLPVIQVYSKEYARRQNLGGNERILSQ